MDRREFDTFSTCLHGISGSLASGISTLLLYPVENIRAR